MPRRRGELTFEGEMWIDTLSLGLRHVEAKISEGANVNFVRNYAWSQTYDRHEDRWVLAREENLADISMREGGMGFTAIKPSSIQILNSPLLGQILFGHHLETSVLSKGPMKCLNLNGKAFVRSHSLACHHNLLDG